MWSCPVCHNRRGIVEELYFERVSSCWFSSYPEIESSPIDSVVLGFMHCFDPVLSIHSETDEVIGREVFIIICENSSLKGHFPSLNSDLRFFSFVAMSAFSSSAFGETKGKENC